MNRLSDADGHFIAGFLEGEAHFGIGEANGGQSYTCFMSLRVRDDDAELVNWLQATTGVGLTRPVAARATSRPQVEWRVQTKAGCRTLAALLARYEVRGRRRQEVEIWHRAIEIANGGGDRARVLRRLRERLGDSRTYRPPPARPVALPESRDALRAYLHGLLCAEGSFSLRISHAGLTVHLRADDRPLLETLAGALGIGTIHGHPAYGSSRPSASWRVSRLDDVSSLAPWLEPRMLRGRKAAELAVWLQAVDERRRAKAAGIRAPRSRMEQLVAEFQAAREYRPGSLRAIGAQPKRDETIEILRCWAETEPGSLGCTRYSAVRQPEWPTRGTIARRFGSWDAALRASGLDHRAPRSAPRIPADANTREAHRQAQRERVLQTLRYGIAVHGSIPTAMQFFRWRLIEAPATPTQATVYRLFPGGWQAVLDALGDVDAGVM